MNNSILTGMEFVMFSMFLKVAFRNLFRNRISTLINLVGLSIAFGCCVLTFMYIDFWLRKDQCHENAEQIYMLGNVIEHNNNAVTWAATPAPMAQTIRDNCPTVENVSGVSVKFVTLITVDDAFSEMVHFVESDFFEMFSFKLAQGNFSSFDNPQSIFITENMATKYFGNENPIGQELDIQLNNSRREQLVVQGVFEKLPETSSFIFEFLLPYQNLQNWDLTPLDDWQHWTRATFIQMLPGESPENLTAILNPYLERQREVNGDWGVKRLQFFNLLDLSQNDYNIRMNMIAASDKASTLSLVAISFVLILLACFNYANNRIVSLSRRFREIGIRKVVGSTKSQLIFQFTGENFLFVGMSLIAGIFIAYFLLIPGLRILFEGGWEGLVLSYSPRTTIFILSAWILTSIGAGLYPAFIVSRFLPVHVFRGASSMQGQNLFVRIMITAQFALTLLALIIPVGLYLNARYLQSLDWGYNQSGVLTVPTDNGRNFQLLETELKGNAGFISVAGGRDHIGKFINVASVDVDGTSHETISMQVGPGYLETMEMRIKKGRTFGLEYKSSLEEEIIVNEMFVEEHGWEYALEKTVKIDDVSYRVVGVVENFHTDDFSSKLRPLIMRAVSPEQCRYMVVRLPEGQLISGRDEIREIFRGIFPDLPYSASFQDEVFAHFERRNKSVLGVFAFSGSAALLIAVMGLFGLVSATLQKREKEIGIRKVLGATVAQILKLITSPITLILLIGSVIAIVPGWFLLEKLLNSFYEYHQGMNALPFVFSFCLLLFVSVATTVLQSIKAATSNPVDSIRNE